MKTALTITAAIIASLSITHTATGQGICTTVDPMANTWRDTAGRSGTYSDMGSGIAYRGMRHTHTVKVLVEQRRGSGIRRTCRAL